MRSEPDGLPRSVLTETLRGSWGLDVASLAYAPVGFGSHHWIATGRDGSRRFVTADSLVDGSTQEGEGVDAHFEGLRAAFETAATLRRDGLEFVLAPEPTTTGEAIARPARDWSVAVFPFVESRPMGPGSWSGVGGQIEAARLVGRLHRAMPPRGIRRWTPAIPHRNALEDALRDLDASWRAGPYGEPARKLLAPRRGAIEASLDHYDRLAAHVLTLGEPWVVTHGEPHSANFLRSATGEIHLIDWDTVLLAPRERDLELGEGEAFEAYRRAAAAPPVRPEVRELFRVRWSIADVCIYVSRFRRPHTGSRDDQESWRHLQAELERLVASVPAP